MQDSGCGGNHSSAVPGGRLQNCTHVHVQPEPAGLRTAAALSVATSNVGRKCKWMANTRAHTWNGLDESKQALGGEGEHLLLPCRVRRLTAPG